MKNPALKRISLILAVLTLAAALLSCGGGGTGGSDVTDAPQSDNETTAAETEFVYDYGSLDMEGEEFKILNTEQPYMFYSNLDFEELTGDALDDEIFARNRAIESSYNLEIAIDSGHSLQAASTALQNTVLAGDDVYKAAYLRDTWIASLLTGGCLADQQDCDSFRFDMPWWDGNAIELNRFGGRQAIFFSFNDVSLVDFEGTVTVFFNEDMMEDLGIEFPYQTARDGKWTLDAYAVLAKAGTNLNGADSYAWVLDGDAIYGCISYEHFTDSFIIGGDVDFFTLDADNNPRLATQGAKFDAVVEKVLRLCVNDGEWLFLNNPEPNHYEIAFKNSRTLMTVAQLKAANKYRDMETSYGILPIPKYDEAQENYRCLRSYTYVLCIPATNADMDNTAVVMDALAYRSYADVMPVFYEGRVSQKTLRNQDSIDMLAIMRDSRYYDIGQAYGWGDTIKAIFRSCAKSKKTEYASDVESKRTAIEASIEKIIETIG